MLFGPIVLADAADGAPVEMQTESSKRGNARRRRLPPPKSEHFEANPPARKVPRGQQCRPPRVQGHEIEEQQGRKEEWDLESPPAGGCG